MKPTIILFLTIAICFSCKHENKNSGSLSGSLKNINDGTILSIVDLDSNVVLERVTVEDGKFKVKLNFHEPRLCGIWGDNPKYDKDRLILWLENAEINIEGNYDYFLNSKIAGSKSNLVYTKLDSINKKYEHEYTRLRLIRSQTTDKIKLDSISKGMTEVLEKYRTAKIDFYSSNYESHVALYHLSKQMTNTDITWYGISIFKKEDIELLYNKLPESLKSSKRGIAIKEYLSLPKTPVEGEKFIDIFQQTPDGKTLSIGENLGKFTILEFWSSYCGPCRAEHSSLRKLYEKYNKKGLSIISISSDTDKDKWENAIKMDSLLWINISDLKGPNNKAFLIYGIKSIPQLILLDQNGIIIDTKLAMKSTSKEIERIFKQNGL